MANWKHIPGAGPFKRISVGSVTNVWGINSAGNILRYNGNDTHPWVQIPGVPGGHVLDISAGADGTVVGVNSNGTPYHYTWDASHWGGYPPPPRPFTRITAGSRSDVYGVDSYGEAFRYSSEGWVLIDGAHLSDISAGADGVVWGVDAAGSGRRCQRDFNIWEPIPNSLPLTAISVGSVTSVWGVNSAGPNMIYWYTGNDASPWFQIPGVLESHFVDIGAGADGTVWGVDSNGNVYRYIRS